MFNEAYAVGAHVLTAEYAGDTNHNAKIGTGTLTVVKASTALTSTSVAARVGVTVTLTGKLTRTTDAKLLAGQTLRFQIDGVDVGTATTDGVNVTTFSYTIPATLAVGAHTLTVIFDGSAFYLAKTATKTLTVNP